MNSRGSRVVALSILLASCSEGMGSGGDGGAADGGAMGADAATGDAGSGSDGSISGDASIADDASNADDASTAGDGGGADAGADGGTTACTPGFGSPPIEWQLPKGASEPFSDTHTISCPAGGVSPRYSLFDLDGDGLSDLVVTGICGGGSDPGLTHWRLHRNTGAGFAAGTSWPLPSGYPGGFPEAELGCASGSARRYRTFDIDGDGLRDLVITSECSGGMVGRTHWIAHLNTGAGFSGTASSFALPSYTGSFDDADETACAGTEPRHALLDVDGDRDPDLVVTSLCDGSMMVGRSRWLVHVNDGARFAAASVDYALPSGYPGGSFTTTTNEACPFLDSPRFATTDLDGDGMPDLVVTSLCSGGPIGRARWDVHRGSASGLAASATSWALPAYAGGNFLTLEGPASCASGAQPFYRVRDADGDGAPDLLVTGLCSGSGALGRTEWAVHLGTGAGFDAPLAWALPPDYLGAPLTDTETVLCDGATSPRYDTTDLNGDGVMDFVATAYCSGAGMLSRAYWWLHPGCAP